MINNKLGYKILAYFSIAAIFLVALYAAIAATPLGPSSFTIGESSKQNESAYPAGQQNAYAGNITEINITASTQTKHWQGYYGSISGTIVLDDAQNYTLYDWANAEPRGEVYATPNSTTPSWSNMQCFNFTGNYTRTSNGVNFTDLQYWERFYNMTWFGDNDVDGLNETFNSVQHVAFDIGDVRTILINTCPSTFMHMNDTFQTDKFSEVLLADNTTGSIVFTAIIENDDDGNNTDVQGYKGNPFTPDFQMLVAEDGTSRAGGGQINTATTTYYFYVDLE